MKQNLLLTSRYLLGVVFALSGILKLISPEDAAEFVSHVLSMKIQVSMMIVLLGSVFEVGLGAVFLLVTSRTTLAAIISASMMMAFSAIGVLMLGDIKSCGCFGGLYQSQTDHFFIARNLTLLLISMFLLRHSSQQSNQR